MELLCYEKLSTTSNRKINHYSIAKNLPRDLIKEILLSENNTNTEKQNFNSVTSESENNNHQNTSEELVNQETEPVLSADDFLRLHKKLEESRNQVANLEKEICEGGKLTTDAISPLWSNISHHQNNRRIATEQ